MKAEGPNDLMMTDFKGHFRLRNGSYCYPLTIVDGFSRYILACDALGSSEDAPTRRVFERVFRTYGLPRRILSDNGSPFASAPAWPDSPDFLSGGYGWASESSALFLGGPSKTGAHEHVQARNAYKALRIAPPRDGSKERIQDECDQ